MEAMAEPVGLPGQVGGIVMDMPPEPPTSKLPVDGTNGGPVPDGVITDVPTAPASFGGGKDPAEAIGSIVPAGYVAVPEIASK